MLEELNRGHTIVTQGANVFKPLYPRNAMSVWSSLSAASLCLNETAVKIVKPKTAKHPRRRISLERNITRPPLEDTSLLKKCPPSTYSVCHWVRSGVEADDARRLQSFFVVRWIRMITADPSDA